MQPLNSKYIRSIRAALADKGLTEEKESLVHQYTNKRTTHISEMTTREALALLSELNKGSKPADKRGKMIRLIHSLCYQMELTDQKGELDKKRMAALVERLSPEHKKLNEHNYEELKILCSLFRKYYREYTKNYNPTPAPSHEEIQV